jgi:His-Xaa-Ser system radical SAM maturase HxsB
MIAQPPKNDNASFQLYPFRFRRLDGQELLVNEVGEFLFARAGTAGDVLRRCVPNDSALYRNLVAKQFIREDHGRNLDDVLATKYRTKKAFLGQGVGLHILVLTLRCDHACRYCQVSSKPLATPDCDMSLEDIERCIAFMMRTSGSTLTLEVQGGEPLAAPDRLRFLIEKAQCAATAAGKDMAVVVCTTLSMVDRGMLEFFRDRNVSVSTSLDGPQQLHDHCRIRASGGSYEAVVRGLGLAREILGMERISALTTVSSYSLRHGRQIVDEFVQQGFRTIFLRQMSRLGRAAAPQGLERYSIEAFMEFYFDALEYILSLNRSDTELAEAYAAILLRKILTPFPAGYVNLQSPAGPGTGVVVYHYNGDIYSQDEGRMLGELGDQSFRLGSVREDDPERMLQAPELVAMLRDSCSESLPGCADCAYLPFCGCDPVFNYVQQGRVAGSRPTNDWCRFNMALFDYLFRLIRGGDRQTQRILMAWARRVSASEVQQAGVGPC